ncbi:MAG: ZIP family metal transporter [Nitrospinota bacterium]
MLWFQNLHPVMQALTATVFTWFMTALGSSVVFLGKEMKRKSLDVTLGFAAGVMIAASFWSLLQPSIELSAANNIGSWFPAAVGFLFGGFVLRLLDGLLPHLHPGFPDDETEGVKTSWHRSTLLVLAITLHNIPEGLAVGVAFGAAAAGYPEATLTSAMILAFGIGIQNLPEGAAVSWPLRREGMPKFKCLWYGQLSGAVEPIGGVVGAAAVVIAKPILPYAMAFAAGAMIYVVAEELIPESQNNGYADQATIGLMVGFTIMMILDVAFG